MTSHVNKLLSDCFYHLRQLHLVRRSLDCDAVHALVRAPVHSRLDYCNGLLAGLPTEKFKRLESVLRSAARLIYRLPSHASVGNLISNGLHWLIFPQRVIYKLCVLMFKCQHGLAPGYLTRHCIPVASLLGRRQLRSASNGQLQVPFRKTKTVGRRGLSVSGPLAWNPRFEPS